ncbi:hypothetical protein, partial [Flagellimonas marinaquae]
EAIENVDMTENNVVQLVHLGRTTGTGTSSQAASEKSFWCQEKQGVGKIETSLITLIPVDITSIKPSKLCKGNTCMGVTEGLRGARL